MSFPFNVRVYGVLEVEGFVLLSTEKYAGKTFTKFPGGALEFGEGLRDALKREFMEETGLRVLVGEHLYTTDFFQESAFNPNQQVIAVYYRVSLTENGTPLERVKSLENMHEFFWVSLNEISADHFTFPIDKYVCAQFLV